MFGLVNEETAKLYRKRNHDARDSSLINEHMWDVRNWHMEADDKTVAAGDILLDKVDTKYHSKIRAMLRIHQEMWNGRLVNNTVIENKIYLVEEARPFKVAPIVKAQSAPSCKSSKSNNS